MARTVLYDFSTFNFLLISAPVVVMLSLNQITTECNTVRNNLCLKTCPRRSMDRIWVCGTHDVGSSPAEGTTEKTPLCWSFFSCAREHVSCLTCVQKSKRLSLSQRAEGEVRCETCIVPVGKDKRTRGPADVERNCEYSKQYT